MESSIIVTFGEEKKKSGITLIGFDKFKKIAYGYRSNNINRLDLIKFSILTSEKEKIIAKLRFHYPLNLDVSSVFEISINSDGDSVGICQIVRNGFLENGKKCSFIFHIFSLDTLMIKTYYVDELDDTNGFVLNGSLILHSKSIGWIFCYVNYGFSPVISKYYHLRVNEQNQSGLLEYLTSFNYILKPFEMMSDDNLVCLSGLSILHIYDIQSNTWIERSVINVPLTENFNLFGSDLNSLYMWLIESDTLFKFDREIFSWIELKQNFCSVIANFIEWITTSESIFFKQHQTIRGEFDCDINGDDVSNDEDDAEERGCYYYSAYQVKVSLADICALQLTKTIRKFSDDCSEEEICNQLMIPPNLVRQFFGPKWSLKNKAEHIDCFITLAPSMDNSSTDNDDGSDDVDVKNY